MKKTVCLLLTAVIVLSAVLLSASVSASGLKGDVDKSGEVNNKDVVALFREVSAAK